MGLGYAHGGRLVPDADDGGLALVAEDADRRGVEREEPARVRLEAEPPGREDAQDVAVREDGAVAGERAKLFGHPVSPHTDLSSRLAAGDAAPPERPAWALLADLGRGSPLVVAVVPLAQVVPPLRDVAVAGEPARLRSALEGALQDESELPLAEVRAERLRLLPPAVGERDVGAAGVLAGAAPLRLPVPDEDDLRPASRHPTA